MAVAELIDRMGRAQIEEVLRLSAEGVAGPPHPGRECGAIRRHGRERGTVCLKECMNFLSENCGLNTFCPELKFSIDLRVKDC